MKMQKLGALCLSKERCMLWKNCEGTVNFIGCGGALYRVAENFPYTEKAEQLAAVFGYSPKQAAKVTFDTLAEDDLANMGGLDLRDAAEDETPCEVMELGVCWRDTELLALLDEYGEAAFIDRALLGPVADEVKNGAYIRFYRRVSRPHGDYYLLKDGMDLLAVFLRVRFDGSKFADSLCELRDAVLRTAKN